MERKFEENPFLVKKAEKALQSAEIRDGVNHLLEEVAKADMNPGLENVALGNGIFELRHKSGSRVIAKETPGDVVLILGITNKETKLQDDVITEVLTFYRK